MERNVANIKDVVGAVMEKVAPDKFKKDILKAALKKAVGDEASRHCKAIGIRKKVLIVAVDSSSWIYHLSLEKHQILKKVKAYIKDEPLIEEIRFRMGA